MHNARFMLATGRLAIARGQAHCCYHRPTDTPPDEEISHDYDGDEKASLLVLEEWDLVGASVRRGGRVVKAMDC